MGRKPRVALSDTQKHSVYQMHLSGESAKDIAAAYDISKSSVYRIIESEREHGSEDMARREMVIAGDKFNGRLVSCSGSRGVYKGTCMVNGKMRTRDFKCASGRAAEREWSDWCMDLRESEKSFLEACEPRVDHDEPVAEYEEDVVIDAAEEPEPIDVVMNPTERVAYVVWCKSSEPKIYGLYGDMDSALADVERLNEVSMFLGNENAFEVDECPWRHV
jgi:hypothetical protein